MYGHLLRCCGKQLEASGDGWVGAGGGDMQLAVGRKGSTSMAGKACLGKADPFVEGPGSLLGLLQTLSNGVRLLVHCQ